MRFITFSPFFFADKTPETLDGFVFLFLVLLPIRFRNLFIATFAEKLSFLQILGGAVGVRAHQRPLARQAQLQQCVFAGKHPLLKNK